MPGIVVSLIGSCVAAGVAAMASQPTGPSVGAWPVASAALQPGEQPSIPAEITTADGNPATENSLN